MIQFKTRLRPSPHLIDLTPLVDVIFLLLIFFIITSDILPLKSLNVENPKLSSSPVPLTSKLVVVMDAQHVIYVGSKKTIVDFPSLKTYLLQEKGRLQTHLPQRAEPTIVLSIDRRVDYETFLRLFQIAGECSQRVRLSFLSEEAAEG